MHQGLLLPICTIFQSTLFLILKQYIILTNKFPSAYSFCFKNKISHLVSNAALNLNNGKHIPGISCSIGMINILSLSALESLFGSTVTCSNREPIWRLFTLAKTRMASAMEETRMTTWNWPPYCSPKIRWSIYSNRRMESNIKKLKIIFNAKL